MRRIKAIIKTLFTLVLLLSLAIVAFLYLAPTFGALPSGASLARIQSSVYYKDGRFSNITDTVIDTSDPEHATSLASFFFPPAGKNPQQPLPSAALNLSELTNGKFAWLGHSTVLYNSAGKFILTDPVFNRASPVPLVGNPFPLSHSITVKDLPVIDVVLISHDHYDHLDHLAIGALNNKTTRFLVPLGIAAHLIRWGIDEQQITEFDWYESTNHNGIDFTFTPSRHFSGRGFTNRFSTLWGSWVIKSPELTVWFSGDGGYSKEVKKIGEKFGPFDVAFIENGAYSKDWMQIHMTPEQAVQASRDLRAKVFVPIHWSKFDLAFHTWEEPIERASKEAALQGVTIATPKIGEIFSVEQVPDDTWWKTVE